MRADVANPRIDKLLFWLRWLPVVGALLWFFLVPTADGETNFLLLAVALGGAVYNVLAMLVLWFFLPPESGVGFGIVTLVLDGVVGVLLFFASGAEPLIMIAGGLFPALVAWVRYGVLGGMAATLGVGIADVVLLLLNGGEAPVYLVGVFVLLVAGASVWALYRVLRAVGPPVSDVEEEALQLRAARERARATFEMTAALSASLNFQDVLEAALEMGALGLRGSNGDTKRMIGCAMIFDNDELVVAAGRSLTRNDAYVRIPGRQGVVELALRQAEPIFTDNPHDDPELNKIAALQKCRSVLCIPLRAGYDNFGILILGVEEQDAFEIEQVELFGAIGTQATVAMQNAVLFNNLQREKDRIVEVDKEARKILARDLHDGPTQTVANVVSRINYISMMVKKGIESEQIGKELWDAEEVARQAVKEIRGFLYALRPLALESKGLAGALEELAQKTNETYNQNVKVQVKDNCDERLSEEAQDTLFNITIETVNNARKHAKADHIWVRLYMRQDAFVYEVKDDGVGFDIKSTMDSYLDREDQSLGMVNLRERAALIDGILQINSTPGEGTTIQVLLPLDSKHLNAKNP